MYNDSDTPANPRPEGREDVAGRRRSVVDALAAKRPEGRLEDVEKLVRIHDREIEQLVDAVCEIMSKLSAMGVSWCEVDKD